jgi:glutamine amidotransferase-like uncharacterized protein
MDGYQQYAAINKRLAKREKLRYGYGPSVMGSVEPDRRGEWLFRPPRIGVYAGPGASHSWLWFATILDRMAFTEVRFIDDKDVRSGLLDSLDVFIVSGGDTFAIAQGLGPDGAERLELFIRKGGLYLGSCAGAYLPLKSSKTYLNWFNFVDIKIANLTKARPDAKRLQSKACTAYGCTYVFHPVREEVLLRTTGQGPFAGVKLLYAPLYGGPPMVSSRPSEVLARYGGFTEKTLFLLDESIAADTLLGKAAAVRVAMGDGRLYLFGPHFEHPRFPVANCLLANSIFWDLRREAVSEEMPDEDVAIMEDQLKHKFVQEIKREVSNSRIVATGMETMPIHWLIGCKTYEPEKIRVFLEAIWSRIKALAQGDKISMRSGSDVRMIECARRTTLLLRKIKNGIDANEDTLDCADNLFSTLRDLTMMFLDMYFRSCKRNGETAA